MHSGIPRSLLFLLVSSLVSLPGWSAQVTAGGLSRKELRKQYKSVIFNNMSKGEWKFGMSPADTPEGRKFPGKLEVGVINGKGEFEVLVAKAVDNTDYPIAAEGTLAVRPVPDKPLASYVGGERPAFDRQCYLKQPDGKKTVYFRLSRLGEPDAESATPVAEQKSVNFSLRNMASDHPNLAVVAYDPKVEFTTWVDLKGTELKEGETAVPGGKKP